MKKSNLLIPFVSVLASVLLIFTTLDYKFLDLFQKALPSAEENPKVLMVNIDDSTIENVGVWPLSRDVYAQTLITLKDLGASQAVFDLSFVDSSQAKVNETYVTETLPVYIKEHLSMLKGMSNISEADIDAMKDNIVSSVSYVINPVDQILAKALYYFKDSFLNVTMDNASGLSEADAAFLSNYIQLNAVDEGDSKTPEFTSFMPSLKSFIEKSSSAGFVNADPDSDGHLRRLFPIFKYNGKYFGQLVFVPLLKKFGNPEVHISNNSITLKNANVNGEVKDISIPRTANGSVIVRYPSKKYTEYNSIPLWNIYRIHLLEENLFADIEAFGSLGMFTDDDNSPSTLMSNSVYLKNELMGGERPDEGVTFENYFEFRSQLMSNLENFINTLDLNTIVFDDSDSAADASYRQEVQAEFDRLKNDFIEYKTSFNEAQTKLKDSMCIFGTCATSTTDYGINLYEEHYPNPGVHYSFANQILSQSFIRDCPVFVSIILAVIFCFGMSLISYKIKGTGRQIILGIGFSAFSIISLFVFFLITKIFVDVSVPLVSTLITFIALTVIGFLTTSKDKKFITNAFGQCLSKEVVNEIIANPDSFKLGGQKLEMTAIFTDIQKFSSFSELLTAGELVALLNYYLTKMSDIIMEERGTVDKYEGDAIIALVGAPVKMDDNADRAVKAAIKMKASEVVMNEEIKKIAGEPKPEEFDDELYSAFVKMVENKKTIFTRIGINSGEMIAGYMGSENKKNYTMMGNNVNLASRLEGVNKQYSTAGILISESTKNMLSDQFILRRLDRVQVVNVNTPLRLFEPLALKEAGKENLVKYVEVWESAMDLFEGGDYEKSLSLFKTLSEKNPKDKVALYYINLIENFFVKGSYPVEKDGVGVEYNPELKAFRLLQK